MTEGSGPIIQLLLCYCHIWIVIDMATRINHILMYLVREKFHLPQSTNPIPSKSVLLPY